MSGDSSDRSARERQEQNTRGQGGQQDRPPQHRSDTHGHRPQGQPGHPQGQPRGSQYRHRDTGIDFKNLPWVSGAINGVAYFISAFIVSGFVFLADILYTFNDVPSSGDFFLYGIGWKFYDNHLVSIPDSFGLLSSELTIPEVGYYLIPALFLFLAGRSVARSLGNYEMPNQQLAVYGTTVIAGYLPVAVTGAIVLETNGVGPDLATTVILMGLIYPALFGTLGGYLAKR